MANQFINAMSQTWANVATTFTAIKMNVTNSASAAASKLMDLQVGGVSMFSVSKTGAVASASTITAGGAALPLTDDGAALGSTSLGWADLFLASGGTINANNGNAVITHSSGVWTVSTGDLRVTTAGTNAASVVTKDGTQTLLNKTLTSPTIGTSPTAAGATWTSLGTVTTIDINGGTIDGTVIGGSSKAAIGGTTGTFTGAVSMAGLTATTGTFSGAVSMAGLSATTGTFSGAVSGTTGTFSSTVTGATFVSTSVAAILAPSAAGTVYLRPQGVASATNQTYVDSNGNMVVNGTITVTG